MIAVFFYHKTTRDPWIWLSPTVTGANLNSNSIVVNWQAMTESVLPWWYTHPYNLDSEVNYAFTFEPNDSDYIYAFKEAFIPASWGGWGGGFTVNYQAINNHTTNAINRIKESIPDYTEKLNEIDSHIDIAKWEVITTIESIEIPEADISSITTWIGTLKWQFTKLSEWIKRKDDKEKSDEFKEKEGEYSGMVESIEKEFETLLSSKDKEIEALKNELKEEKSKEDKYEAMVQVLEEEINETKEKTEKETKENILKTLETL